MKKIFTLLILALIFSCTQSNKTESSYNVDEIIFVVEMDSNEGKTIEEITEFSKFYTDAIDANESNSLGWGFYEYGDDILFIERFKNEGAIISHAKNVSEGGVLQKDYAEYNYYFEPYKVDVFGKVSQDLKDYLEPYNLPIFYYPNIVSFSKGYESKWEELN